MFASSIISCKFPQWKRNSIIILQLNIPIIWLELINLLTSTTTLCQKTLTSFTQKWKVQESHRKRIHVICLIIMSTIYVIITIIFQHSTELRVIETQITCMFIFKWNKINISKTFIFVPSSWLKMKRKNKKNLNPKLNCKNSIMPPNPMKILITLISLEFVPLRLVNQGLGVCFLSIPKRELLF